MQNLEKLLQCQIQLNKHFVLLKKYTVMDNNPLGGSFLWVLKKSRLVRAARETSKFHNLSLTL